MCIFVFFFWVLIFLDSGLCYILVVKFKYNNSFMFIFVLFMFIFIDGILICIKEFGMFWWNCCYFELLIKLKCICKFDY